MPDAAPPDPTDADLAASLELFNDHLTAEAERQRGEKIVAKAERRKNEAANRLRNLNNDPDASAEAKAEAEATYRAAVDELAARTADPFGTDTTGEADPPPPDASEAAAPEAPTPDDAGADDATAGEADPDASEAAAPEDADDATVDP